MAGIFGYSMGASTCIMAMAENRLIAAGMFESGFPDFDAIIRERAEREIPEFFNAHLF